MLRLLPIVAIVALAVTSLPNQTSAQGEYRMEVPGEAERQRELQRPDGASGKDTPTKRFFDFADKYEVMKPGKDSITTWNAEASIDTSNPYGRIAVDCLNQQDGTDPAAMRQANRCMENRAKAHERTAGRKPPQPAPDEVPAALPEQPAGLPEQPAGLPEEALEESQPEVELE